MELAELLELIEPLDFRGVSVKLNILDAPTKTHIIEAIIQQNLNPSTVLDCFSFKTLIGIQNQIQNLRDSEKGVVPILKDLIQSKSPKDKPQSIVAYCPKCEKQSPPQALRCISCGDQFPSLFCTSCGTSNVKEAKFCMSCGEER